MAHTGRITGVKTAELIEDAAALETVFDSLVNDPSHWVLVTKLDWKANGFAVSNDSIYVPSTKNGRKTTGDIIASVGDYVLSMNDGRKTIIFTPELKERISRKDFSWLK